MDFKKYIKNVKDYPQKGINFKDITPLLASKDAYYEAVAEMASFASKLRVDVIVSPEARGFLFGCGVAYAIKSAFVPVRKPGKLPRKTISVDYEVEYGKSTLCIHKDAIKKGQRVLIIDDLLATGGTIHAAENLIAQLGGNLVGYCFLIHLKDLNGLQKLNPKLPIKYLLEY